MWTLCSPACGTGWRSFSIFEKERFPHTMKEMILAYQGEMTLKGLNRNKFEARLAKSIRYLQGVHGA